MSSLAGVLACRTKLRQGCCWLFHDRLYFIIRIVLRMIFSRYGLHEYSCVVLECVMLNQFTKGIITVKIHNCIYMWLKSNISLPNLYHHTFLTIGTRFQVTSDNVIVITWLVRLYVEISHGLKRVDYLTNRWTAIA